MAQTVVLAADEIGLGYGRIGDVLLRSEAQPVFRRRGGRLWPEAAVIRAFAQRKRQTVAWGDFLAGLSADELAEVEKACRELDTANHSFISDEPVELLLGRLHDGCEELTEQQRFQDPFGDPGPVYFPLSASARRSDDELSVRVRRIRSAGMRVCLTDFGGRASIEGCLDAVRPDIVQVDAAWLARMADHAALRRLMAQLVDRLHRRGIEVLIQGIDDAPRLAAAIAAGADLIAGDALVPFAPAGTGFDTACLEIAAPLAQAENIIPVAFQGHGRWR